MYMTVLKMDKESLLSASNPLDLNSTYSIHQWVTNQQDCSRKEENILYRIINRFDDIFLYIQSENKFNLEGIEQVGLKFFGEIDVQKMLDEADDYVFFDIKCFPCQYKNQKAFFIKDPEKRIDWLKNMLKKHGATLVDCSEYKVSSIIMDKYKRNSIRIPVVSMEGRLRIDDKEAFTDMVSKGLGRLKNFGLGLVMFHN